MKSEELKHIVRIINILKIRILILRNKTNKKLQQLLHIITIKRLMIFKTFAEQIIL